MGGGLQVDPGDYAAASDTIGTLVAATINNATDHLATTLSRCAGMAGSDPAGTGWAAGYDNAADAVLTASQDALNGTWQLAGLLEQTGFNYSRAESESTPGDAPPALDTTDYTTQHAHIGPPPAAAGHNEPSLPGGWSLVQTAVGRAWPNGHQDKLRAAADSWSDGAYTLNDASASIANAVASIAQQTSPETDDAITVCNGLRDDLDNLAHTYDGLHTACADYADYLDQAHSQIEHELINLLEWSAGIQIAGAIVSCLTFGAAEAPTQAEQAERIAITGSRIAAIIDRLATLAATTRATLTTLTAQAADITTSLNPLLTARRAIAATTRAAATSEVRTATRLADDALSAAAAAERGRALPVARQFRNREKLIKHFGDHRSDFGATTPEEYQAKAARFLERAKEEGLPMKVDAKGTIRIYDPSTNSFGSYTSDGTILTYFKPSSPTYWQRQPGS